MEEKGQSFPQPSTRSMGGTQKSLAETARLPFRTRYSLQENDVRSTVTAALLHDLELHTLSLSEGSVASGRGERRVVDENVLAAGFVLNAAIALRVVKP